MPHRTTLIKLTGAKLKVQGQLIIMLLLAVVLRIQTFKVYLNTDMNAVSPFSQKWKLF
jgi:hypothetical protein